MRRVTQIIFKSIVTREIESVEDLKTRKTTIEVIHVSKRRQRHVHNALIVHKGNYRHVYVNFKYYFVPQLFFFSVIYAISFAFKRIH